MPRRVIGVAAVVTLLASAFLMTAPAAAQSAESSMSANLESRNKALIKEKFDAWRAGTGGPFDLLAEDVSWTIVGRSLASRTYESREEFMREVIRPFNARMRVPLRPTIRDLYADGDTVVILFDAEATTIDGKPYRNTYAWFMEMRDGRMIRVHAFFDSIEFNELWDRVEPPKSD